MSHSDKPKIVEPKIVYDDAFIPPGLPIMLTVLLGFIITSSCCVYALIWATQQLP